MLRKHTFTACFTLALTTMLFAGAHRVFAQTPTATAMPAASATKLSPGQMDALLAPIALYPDRLLAKISMGATYPQEVVEAQRWLEQNAHLKGAEFDAALQQQKWDDSIKGLVRVPSALKMMNEQIEWTRKLGAAVLTQEHDVMAAIQRLRSTAEKTGSLKSTEQQTVETVDNNIVIEPKSPDAVYMPYYEPRVVYGNWPYPQYPPYHWPAPGYGGYGAGLGFLSAAPVGSGWWDDGWNWGGGGLYVDHGNNFNNYRDSVANGTSWQHDPSK